MELLIAQSIRRHRKARDLTQEQLAAALGISPQSISKWECGDGYPDITMLPVIANYFKITVDELIGNDDIGRRADEEKFWERYNMLHDKPEEQLEHCRDYYRKYPEDFNNMVEIGYIITQNEMRKELPLLREVCEKIISSCTLQYHRQQAAEYMCMFCGDEELEQWLNLCAPSYEAFRGEVLEERFWQMKKYDESREQNTLNNLCLIVHFLTSRGRYWCRPDLSVASNAQYRSFHEWLGEGQGVPQGWLAPYALATLRLSAGYFGCGKKEEGYVMLEEAMALYEKWFSIPTDALLPLGNLFSGLTMRKHSGCVTVPSGEEKWIECGYYFHETAEGLYLKLTQPHGWEWFNSVREEERFKAAVARAKTLCDKEKTQMQTGT